MAQKTNDDDRNDYVCLAPTLSVRCLLGKDCASFSVPTDRLAHCRQAPCSAKCSVDRCSSSRNSGFKGSFTLFPLGMTCSRRLPYLFSHWRDDLIVPLSWSFENVIKCACADVLKRAHGLDTLPFRPHASPQCAASGMTTPTQSQLFRNKNSPSKGKLGDARWRCRNIRIILR